MHGAPRSVKWTELSVPIAADDSSLTVKEAVDWVAGDKIVVAATSYNASETEKRIIQSVSGDGLTITVNTPFKYGHIGKKNKMCS